MDSLSFAHFARTFPHVFSDASGLYRRIEFVPMGEYVPIDSGTPICIYPLSTDYSSDSTYLRLLFMAKDVLALSRAPNYGNIYQLLRRRELGLNEANPATFTSTDDVLSFVRNSQIVSCRQCHAPVDECNCDRKSIEDRCLLQQAFRSNLRLNNALLQDMDYHIANLFSPLSVITRCPMCENVYCTCYYSGDDDVECNTPTFKSPARKAMRANMRSEKYAVHRHYLKEALNKARSPINHLSPQSRTNNIKAFHPMKHFRLQADTVDSELNKLFMLVSRNNRSSPSEGISAIEILKLLEDVGLLCANLYQATNRTQILLAWIGFIKLRTKQSILFTVQQMSKWVMDLLPSDWVDTNPFFSEQRQNAPLHPQVGTGDKIEDWLKFTRGLFDGVSTLKETPIYRKFHTFLVQCFAHTIFVGGDLEKFSSIFMDLEAEAFKNSPKNKGKLAHACLDLLTFLLERGYQCVKLGEITPIMHSSSAYDAWLTEAQDIIAKSPFISNPEAHGFTMSSFLSKLAELIEQGEAIKKVTMVGSKLDHKFVTAQLSRLKLIQNNTLTKKAAMQDRKAPLGILITGDTSVGKSLMSYSMFQYYGKLFGLDTSAEFRYTRNGIDTYWTNFNSSQWHVFIDDAAQARSAKCPQGDNTVNELIVILNNVCYVTIQADIDDKGKTPMLAELVIATTNTEHLNLMEYYQCPQAAARRLPWIINIRPKDEYKTEDGMLNSAILPVVEEGQFPDFWVITVKKVVLAHPKQNAINNVIYKPLYEFHSMNRFLSWFRGISEQYRAQQDKLAETQANMFKTKLCDVCKLPEGGCLCQNPQTPMTIYFESTAEERPFECPACHQRACHCDEITQNVALLEALEAEAEAEFEALENPPDGFRLQVDTVPIPQPIRWDRVQDYTNAIIESAQEARMRPRGWLSTTLIRLSFYLWMHVPFFSVVFWIFPMEILYGFWTSTLGYRTVSRTIMTRAGHRMQDFIGKNKLYLEIAAALGAVGIAGWIITKMFPDPKEEPKVQSKDTEKPIQALPTETVNVWKNDDYKTTDFDVSRTTMSWKGLGESRAISEIAKNVIHVKFTCKEGDKHYERSSNMICIKGNVYLCNNHTFPPNAYQITIMQHCLPSQPNGNITFPIDPGSAMRFPKRDLAFLEILHIPPKKDISALFAAPSFRGVLRSTICHRNESGELVLNNIVKTNYIPFECRFPAEPARGIPAINYSHGSWQGTADTPTIDGQCGSPWIAQSPVGPVILGIHFAGGAQKGVETAVCALVDSTIVNLVCDKMRYTISENTPVLSSQSKTIEVGALHPKCPLRWHKEGNAFAFGSIPGHRPDPKSRVARTPIAQTLLDHGWEDEHGAPCMRGYEPIQKAITPLLKCSNKMDPKILRECKEAFLADILADLSEDDLAQLHPIDNFEAVNGAAGVAFVDAIKKSTSAGFPWNKSKKHFYNFIDPMRGLQHPVEFNAEIMDRVAAIEETYRQGYRWTPVFSDALKDEPVSKKKIKEKKTRVFSGAPVDFLIAMRKMFLTSCRLMCNKKTTFELAVGTNTMSHQWTELLNFLMRNNPALAERIIAGDFGNFDKTMMGFVILLAFEILIDLAEKSGNFDAEDIQRMRGMAVDTAYPLHNLFNDLIMFFGGNPSGQPLTVFINSLANSLYMRYVFAVNSPDKSAKRFREFVHLITYGDDNVMSVTPECTWFNHTIIRDTLADVGIVYTMADKEAESVPFIHIDEATFLKRRWVWSDDLQAYAAPLEEKSIRKALMYHVVSRTDDVNHQIVSAVSNVMREYFMYGKAKYDEMKTFLRQVLKENNLDVWIEESTFQPYSYLRNSFSSGSLKYQDDEDSSESVTVA